MPRRIIEQCYNTDFSSIEHLASITEDPKKLDISILTKTQKAAIRFLILTQRKNIPLSLVKDTIREVLFWSSDEGTTITRIEMKWLKLDRDKILKFKQLWDSNITPEG